MGDYYFFSDFTAPNGSFPVSVLLDATKKAARRMAGCYTQETCLAVGYR
jgi:hypothetical protein